MPIFTSDASPMNELIEDGFDGLLAGSRQDGLTGDPEFR